jgi:hypothetical protein
MIKQGYIQEETDRTVSPFAAVIAEYKNHARKVTERRQKKSTVTTKNELRAVIGYLETATILEAL